MDNKQQNKRKVVSSHPLSKRPAENSLEDPRAAKKSNTNLNTVTSNPEPKAGYNLRPRGEDKVLGKQQKFTAIEVTVQDEHRRNEKNKKNEKSDDVKVKEEEENVNPVLQECKELAVVTDSPMPDVDRYPPNRDGLNPKYVPVYAYEIYTCWKSLESTYQPDANYMDRQPQLKPQFRGVLIDWLVDVHFRFKLKPETIFLTVNLIDRYLSKRTVPKNYLQLLGCTALLVASKYEEIWALYVEDLVKICAKQYQKDQMISMEKNLLKRLDYELTVPTVYHFMLRYLKIAQLMTKENQSTAHLAFYLVELAMVEYKMLQYSPSKLSAAAIHVAMRNEHRPDNYPRNLRKHSGYTLEDLQDCVTDLVKLKLKDEHPKQTLVAVKTKYSKPKMFAVAQAKIRESLENMALDNRSER
eukprot:TRINITY_DN874_c0_g1_i1.p1 TRINITY_DN874_c0_g1~~TRINITY_DN874_c0_g1_i1.p1  ORF type:complete len:444 (-),score=50.69 TRINITY_DN874_c0_g1_i1:823-2058(-)